MTQPEQPSEFRDRWRRALAAQAAQRRRERYKRAAPKPTGVMWTPPARRGRRSA